MPTNGKAPAGTAVVSTVGTSLLTNAAVSEGLRDLLRATANLKREGCSVAELRQIEQHAVAVRERLAAAQKTSVSEFSSELNGIVSGNFLGDAFEHYLLHTDTLQGELCAQIVKGWLEPQVRRVTLFRIEQLNTASQEAFERGIDALLHWCDQTLGDLRTKGYFIVFNLVGGFKSLQAYMHTIGMVYADEICYIFEGPGSPLLRIPRLPACIDEEIVRDHVFSLVRLAVRGRRPATEITTLPEVLVRREGEYVVLSNWGRLLWNKAYREILGRQEEPVGHPELEYTDAFLADFAKAAEDERVVLQQKLAEVAVVFRDGGLQALRADHGIRYENYRNTPGTEGHFRVNRKLRVRCEPIGNRLRLLRFGGHEINEGG
ncbi:MAG: putative CRISPR-associated protein [Chthonomonadales bacterium]